MSFHQFVFSVPSFMSLFKLIFFDEQKPKAAEKMGNQSKNLIDVKFEHYPI